MSSFTGTLQRALQKAPSRRLPLGVASNFRYWGEDKDHLHRSRAQGGRTHRSSMATSYVDYRHGVRAGDSRLRRPTVSTRPRARAMKSGRCVRPRPPRCEYDRRPADLASMVPAAELRPILQFRARKRSWPRCDIAKRLHGQGFPHHRRRRVTTACSTAVLWYVAEVEEWDAAGAADPADRGRYSEGVPDILSPQARPLHGAVERRQLAAGRPAEAANTATTSAPS